MFGVTYEKHPIMFMVTMLKTIIWGDAVCIAMDLGHYNSAEAPCELVSGWPMNQAV